ncbi:MAG: cupin domain-containing protein [Pseudomonadota bacterium]
MAGVAGVVRMPHSDRSGTGLTAWDAIDPASLAAGAPVQRGWIVDQEAQTGYLFGVWDCTAFTEHMGPYAVDEFMLLLEGSVTMGMPDGTDVVVDAGDVFVIPKGLQCQWKQTGYVRKVFMIVDDPVPAGPHNPSLSRITVPDLSAIPADGPVETSKTWFTNATGRMSVDVRSSAGGRTDPRPSNAHQILHVLAGALELTSDAGAQHFGAGETVYIRAGSEVARTLAPGTTWVQSSYVPA